MIQIYLDGTLYENPNGWENLQDRVFYSEDISGYVNELAGNLIFYGGAYAYLRSKFDTGICESVTVQINEACADSIYKKIFDGLIFISDVEWNIVKCSATVQVVDNSYIAKIYNNKAIQAVLGITRSKNNIDITSYSNEQTNISLLASNGGAGVTNASGFRIYDAFRFLVGFMSDGTMEFVSDFFNIATGTDQAATMSVIMNGEEVRTGGSTVLRKASISFEELYKDVNKTFNIAFSFEEVAGVMTMRIEPKSYYEQATEVNYFEYPADIIQQLPQQKLYAKVKFGSSQVVTPQPFLPDLNFYGTQQEEYHLLGTCNSEAELNLRLETLITDTNIIQDLVDNGTNEAYDQNNFLIVCAALNVAQLTPKPGSGGTEFYYNDLISNYRVAQYWSGNLANSIAIWLESQPDNFYAGRTGTAQTITTTLPYGVAAVFNNDSTAPFTDPGGNYNNGTGRYTAPIAGVYTFNTHIDFSIVSPISPDVVRIYFLRYDAANVLQEAVLKQTFNQPSGTDIVHDFSQSFALEATDYVVVSIFGEGTLNIDSTFQSDAIQGGGVVQEYSFTEFSVIENEFTHNIDCQSWADFKADIFRTFTLKHENGIIKGWINDFSRTLKTGETKITLNSKP